MKRKILIVDDDRLSNLYTQRVAEKLGFQVMVLPDGRGAAEAEATGDFDAVVMDCQMPNMDGFQTTAAIRRRQVDDHRAATPIIGLSARSMEGDEDMAIAKGMDAYITKPVSTSKLRAALEQVRVEYSDDPLTSS